MKSYASGWIEMERFKALVWSARQSIDPKGNKSMDHGSVGSEGITPDQLALMRARRPGSSAKRNEP